MWMMLLGQLGGSLLQSGSSSSATQAQEQAAYESELENQFQFNVAQNSLAPYQSAGQGALNQITQMLGLGPTKQTTPYGYGLTPQQLTAPTFTPPAAAPNTTSTSQPYGQNGAGMDKNYAENVLNPLRAPSNGGLGNTAQAFLDPAGIGPKLFGGLARGGQAQAGGTYVVGEHGPEILHMGTGSKGYVEPNSPKANMMAYGRPGTIQHRAYGGPVGAMNSDPIMGTNININPNQPNSTFGVNGSPAGLPYQTAALSPNAGQPAPGSPTAFNPTQGNNTALSSGQTPNQILQAAPEYQFVQQQGIQALDNSAAASGGMLGGNQLAQIEQYGQGLASEQFNNIYNQLASVAGLGQTSSSTAGSLGAYTGSNIGMNLMAAGNAAGSGYINQGNIYSNLANQMAYGYGNNMYSSNTLPQLNTLNQPGDMTSSLGQQIGP